MNPAKALARIPTPLFCSKTRNSGPNVQLTLHFRRKSLSFLPTSFKRDHLPAVPTSVPDVASDVSSAGLSHNPKEERLEKVEVNIEKGCVYVLSSFQDYFVDRGKVIASLVEATDVYLLGTVMLVFGMGLYELFISNLDKAKSMPDGRITYRSNLFGLFTLKERPRWLEIKTVNELKTKLGHVIVMLLLIGLFDKSKKAVIQSPFDLLCFSASVLLSSGCLFLLSKLNE
ncbi:hypothetical protein DH2020_029049 [Rehmannia glutinosa]|uniref:Uncharacterized protein n=1 Tax=Rehmannia glutinosa TaxID=99300 RepID=A0ABR0VQK1_REHGL